MKDDDFPVSDTDRTTEEGGWREDETRRLGEFGRTNSPLSEMEIAARRGLHRKWMSRTTENIDEMKPEPEH